MVGDKLLIVVFKRMSRIGKGEGLDSNKFNLGYDEFEVFLEYKIEVFNS